MRIKGAAVALTVLIVSMTCFTGCGQETSKQGQPVQPSTAQVNLAETYELNGVSFLIDPSWEVDTLFDRIEPSSNSLITVDTFTKGETASMEALEKADALSFGSAAEYTQGETSSIPNGTIVTCYTFTSKRSDLYTIALGYNKKTKAGFEVFFNRGTVDDPGILSDEVVSEIVNTLEFDPSEAKPYDSWESGDGSSSSSGASSTAPTVSQENALGKAEDYLRVFHFSRKGLIDQLEYNKYSHEDAVYAADNCSADWMEQALGKAEDYVSNSAFSRKGLIDQLEYNKFTHKQAVYGADNCGANWMEQAAKKAEAYLKSSHFSRQGLIDQLEYNGFTHKQAIYGAESVGL